MENNKLKIFVFILIVLVLGLGGYIVYDKVFSDNDTGNDTVMEADNNNVNIEDYEKIIREINIKYWDYALSLGVYCGEYDREDYIDLSSDENPIKDYWASTKFKAKKEVESYLSEFLTDDMMPKYLDDEDSYLEQNGKLYCIIPHKGGATTYSDENSNYYIKVDEDKIVAIGEVELIDNMGGSSSYVLLRKFTYV